MDPIHLEEPVKEILEKLCRCPTSPQWLAQRSEIVLLLSAGLSPTEVQRQGRTTRKTVYRWKSRWDREAPRLEAVLEAQEDEKVLTAVIREKILADAPRPGAPPRIYSRADRANRGRGSRGSQRLGPAHQPLDSQ